MSFIKCPECGKDLCGKWGWAGLGIVLVLFIALAGFLEGLAVFLILTSFLIFSAGLIAMVRGHLKIFEIKNRVIAGVVLLASVSLFMAGGLMMSGDIEWDVVDEIQQEAQEEYGVIQDTTEF